MSARVELFGIACALCCFASGAVLAATPEGDWPTFRGADRTSVSKETGLLQQWPKGGPPLVWETAGAGRGYSSLAIAGDRIFVLGDGPSTADDKDEYLLGFDRETGKQVVKTKAGPAWNEGSPSWQGSRSTPTIDGELVYALSAHGDLICCAVSTGDVRWRKNLMDDFEGKKGDRWGYSESVLIDGEKLVCTPGGVKATMIALNKTTGEVIWKCARPNDRGAGHASIVPVDLEGTRIYVQTTATGAMGVRAADGELLWTYDIPATTAVCPSPVVRNDLVFFTAGYKRGGALLRQVPGANGGVEVKEVYPLNTALSNRHGGVVLVGDYLYGDSDHAGIPWCADLMTGEIKWKKRGSGRDSASMIAADGCLYIRYSNGVMVLAKATPDDYNESGSFTVPGSGERPSWAHPVLVGGKLYLREQDRIFCYDVRAQK